ncbi:MAG: hypothetical protein QOI03_139 [Solirubrobacteraceae bacterium]|nr:hypothetical protein [Solirubrobacteraceae bacterium]
MRELPDALVVIFDEQLRFVLAAGQVLQRLGDPARCAAGCAVQDAVPTEVWPTFEPLLRSALAGETRSREVWTTDRHHCLAIDVGPLRGEPAGAAPDASLTGMGIAIVLDTTARRNAEALSQQPDDGFEEIFERAPLGTGLLDLDGRWLLVNRALCDMTGYTAEELTGTRFDGIVHPEDASNDLLCRARLMAGDLAAFQVEKRYFDASGETACAILSMSLVRDREGAPLHYVAQLQDISERKRLEQHLRRLAEHDPLTGLRSRSLFECDLKLQVARAWRYGETAGLLLIGLDDFAQIDERHGRVAGDTVIKAVARALGRRLRQTDLVARVRAEEFAVLLPHAAQDSIAVVAAGLTRVIAGCGVDVGEAIVHPAASIGSVLIDDCVDSAEQVLTRVERAMADARRAKSAAPY